LKQLHKGSEESCGENTYETLFSVV